MWGRPTSFCQKLALEANQEESRHPPCEEIVRIRKRDEQQGESSPRQRGNKSANSSLLQRDTYTNVPQKCRTWNCVFIQIRVSAGSRILKEELDADQLYCTRDTESGSCGPGLIVVGDGWWPDRENPSLCTFGVSVVPSKPDYHSAPFRI